MKQAEFGGKIESKQSMRGRFCRMTNEHEQPGSTTEQTTANNTPYTATVSIDQHLGSTVISLNYKDQKTPARNINVGIAPELGSNLFRFRVGEHDIIFCEDDLLKRMDFTGDFVLWPLPNRVRDKRYTYNGQTYSLADVKRPQGNAVLIHGLVFDRPWQYEQPVVGPESASVTTYVDITPEDPFYAAYPFASRLSLTYQITHKGLVITYRVENRGEKTLPYGFALHPYFTLLSDRDDTYVSLPANTVMEADDELLPTGRVLDVTGIMYGMFDLRQPVPVGNLKLDHVYTDVSPRTAAVIDYRQQSMQLQISATDDFTHIVIFTLAATPSVCIEHQTCSTDAVNLHNQGPTLRKTAHLLELKPGEVGSGSISYTVNFYK
jgi:aldose 1-epimerase